MAEVTDVTITNGLPTAGSGTVPTLSKTNTLAGAVTETAPATDTASSGLNGRLQRIAQRITSLIALVPTALGAAGGFKVEGITTAVPIPTIPPGTNYETVAASQSDQSLGATGATGDYLSHVLIIPATLNPGAVSIKDGAGSAITIFTGGTDSVTSLIPWAVPIMAKSASGAWKVTTGTNVSAFCTGKLT